jgi:hypothetical protein
VSFYQTILAVQEPFDLGVDENDRIVMVCNYDCVAHYPVDRFEEEIGRIIYDAGLGTFGTNMWLSSKATLPDDGLGPHIIITRTPSYFPLETHDGAKYERLSCSISVRSTNYSTARTRAIAIWRALDGQRNVTVTAL